MVRSGLFLGALLGLGIAASAQEPADLRDDELLSDIVVVTEAGEADRLLALMREVRDRGLLMFEDVRECESPVPTTGILDNQFNRGAVNWAYHMEVWARAMAAGDCGCPYRLLSFEEFSEEVAGTSPENIDASDVQEFTKFWVERRAVVEPEYKAFKAQTCGE